MKATANTRSLPHISAPRVTFWGAFLAAFYIAVPVGVVLGLGELLWRLIW